MISRLVCAVIVIAGVGFLNGGWNQRLPSSAEPLLLRCLHAQKIIKINEIRSRQINGYDYLGLFLTVEVTDNFEAWYHPGVILRKSRVGGDWAEADIFSFGDASLPQVFELSDQEFIARLHPWPCE
jgi:hypothetical protein